LILQHARVRSLRKRHDFELLAVRKRLLQRRVVAQEGVAGQRCTLGQQPVLFEEIFAALAGEVVRELVEDDEIGRDEEAAFALAKGGEKGRHGQNACFPTARWDLSDQWHV
jgi:hypothetical protein